MQALNSADLKNLYKFMKFKYSCVGAGALIVVIPFYLAFLYFEKNYNYSFTF